MSEQLLKQILDELQNLNNRVNKIDNKIDHIETKMDKQFEEVKASINSQHIENINSDDLILRSLDEIKESIRFVNRKVADAELDLHAVKKALKQ